MAYYETLKAAGALVPAKGSAVIANTWPAWEVTTPQYPLPNPYPLAQMGYRRNELVFACIQKRANAIAEAPLCVYADTPAEQGTKKPNAREEQPDHALRQLMRRPNDAMGEVEFWQAVQIYMDIAGFSVWEVELSNIGAPLNLWPLRPDWCSFLRGEHQPLRAVRYQPWGLGYQDIPIERCLVFMEFDPLYPMLKGLSRSAVALRVTSVDNAATDFLKLFFENGAVVNGLLKTVQNLTEAESKRIRDLWRKQHGGINNWTDPAVLGSGVEYQQMQMNFKDMAFEAIDGRDEARICQIFEVPPILVGSKVGLDRATYANYKEARQAFYEETITPRWRYLSSEVGEQLMPHYEDDLDERGHYAGDLVADFDLSNVRALQEDRDAKWKRADQGFKGGWATRDEARAEAGLDPIDGDTPVFAADPKSTTTGEEIEQEKAAAAEQQAAQLEVARQQAEQDKVNGAAAGAQPGAAPSGAEPGQVGEPDEKQVVKALAEWRSAVLAAHGREGRGSLPAVPAGIPADLAAKIMPDLDKTRTRAQVREVFDRHWPKPAKSLQERAVAALEAYTALVGAAA